MSNTKKPGRGRPRYMPKFPAKLFWTFQEWEKVNDGKCTKMTLTNFRNKDIWTPAGNPRSNSLIVEIDDTRENSGKSGVGRKQKVYALRAKFAEHEARQAKRSAKNTEVSVNIGTGETNVATELVAA